MSYALCNSFGFGGTNGALLFERFEALARSGKRHEDRRLREAGARHRDPRQDRRRRPLHRRGRRRTGSSRPTTSSRSRRPSASRRRTAARWCSSPWGPIGCSPRCAAAWPWAPTRPCISRTRCSRPPTRSARRAPWPRRSRTLAPFDLVLCGQQGVGGDNSQIPGLLAELLDLPQVTVAVKIEVAGGTATVEREIEGGARDLGDDAARGRSPPRRA